MDYNFSIGFKLGELISKEDKIEIEKLIYPNADRLEIKRIINKYNIEIPTEVLHKELKSNTDVISFMMGLQKSMLNRKE